MKFFTFFIIFVFFCFSACSTASKAVNSSDLDVSSKSSDIPATKKPGNKAEQLLKEAEKYLGTPYHSPAYPPHSFDCSSFVSHVYFQAGYALPRSTSSYADVGKRVKWEDARPGDILVFSSVRGGQKIDHVALLWKKSDKGTLAGSWLIHAASINTGTSFKKGDANTKTGVVITELGLRGDGIIENEYFYQRYMFTTRVLD